ncbi:YbaB/EbfC family nucleoid-associated protein [Actinokineospora inagensis]|uniref:YbaB/EbfC family nucleoid-associated protein n=1 Tax=Actinokineospora inagensis TaxID=103730 RepID=UPI0003FEBE60|nr:YbaB/EbfC family nucleoid-associated protein [Actinokineospora inagensis]
MTNPQQLIGDYERRTAQLLARAEETKARIAALSGTATSSDGTVTTTVNAAGALQNLTFSAKADEMPRDRLAALILATAKRAQAAATGQIAAVMEPLVGANSAAMRFVRDQIPEVEIPPEPAPTPPTSNVPPPQPERRPRPSSPREDDEQDFDHQDQLRKGN